MAVSEQTPYIEYTANGTTTSFALEFDCENQDHLIVLVDDVEPAVGAWALNNGAVVFNTAPENGKKITLQRNTPFSRTADYQSYNNSFRPPAVNNDFDRVWYKIQELGVKDWLLDLKIQKFRDDVNLTALENTLEEAKQIRDDTADSVVEVQSNVAQSQTLLENTTAQANLAQGYANSANSANAAAQQAVIDVSTAEADVYSALSAQQIAVNNSLTAIAGGHKAYQTLAAAQAAQASIPANTVVEVTNDPTSANNGTYQWNGTTLTKSAYDPLTQAKADATTKANTAEANAKSYAENIVSEIAVNADASEIASTVVDKSGLILASVNNAGEVQANDFKNSAGSLTDALNKTNMLIQQNLLNTSSVVTDDTGTVIFGVNSDASIESPYPPIQGFGIDAIRSQILSKEKLNSAGIYLDRLSSDHLIPMKWEVMVAPHATDGMGHCRMGSMYQLSPTKFYVAFTQFKTAGTDQEGGRLVARFVDVDFTNKTSVVGETRVIYDGIPNLEHPPAQPHFFKVKDGVILIFNQDHDLVTYKSTDGCLTWTEIGRYSPSPRTFWLALDGVVQIQNGVYKDRIVAAGFAWAVNGTSSMFLRSMYSDDFGVTWQVGYDFDPATIGLSALMNETGVTVDTNNDLIFIVRNESTTGDRDTTTGKTFFKSTDGGKTVTHFYPNAPFIAAVCQTGIFQFSQNVWSGVPKIITTAPINVGSRNGLKLRISYDNMQSTAWEYNIYPTSLVTGYTSIKRVSPHMLGVVCEYGGFNAISNVVINFINFKEIFNGSYI